MGDHKGTMQNEYDDISMKTKFFNTRFGETSGNLRSDEKAFFIILSDLAPNWDYKPTNAIHVDYSGVYTSEKIKAEIQ